MSLPQILFLAVGLVTLGAAVAVVTSRNVLHSALLLALSFFGVAVLYVLLDTPYLAAAQVLVYIGAISLLIVFAIMLTHASDPMEDRPTPGRALAGGAASLAMLLVSCLVLCAPRPAQIQAEGGFPSDNVREIGTRLLDYGPGGYVLPFEIISLLLLAAALGGIVIARKIPAPAQPFTSGGDLEGEVHYTKPNSQREDDAP